VDPILKPNDTCMHIDNFIHEISIHPNPFFIKSKYAIASLCYVLS